eukprot:4884187-Prymnesium_polylepis.1
MDFDFDFATAAVAATCPPTTFVATYRPAIDLDSYDRAKHSTRTAFRQPAAASPDTRAVSRARLRCASSTFSTAGGRCASRSCRRTASGTCCTRRTRRTT